MKIKPFFNYLFLGICGITSFGVSAIANAQAMICPFTDHFYISQPQKKDGIQILGDVSTTGNIVAQKQDDNDFMIFCKDNSSHTDGNVRVEVGYDNKNKCDVTVTDGPFWEKPFVSDSYCQGNLEYAGQSFIAGNTHDCKLKFRKYKK